MKKILKKDSSIRKDKIIIWEFSLNIFDRSFTGTKPPEDIKLNAKLSESNDLIEKKFKIIKTVRVKPEYKRKIFTACLKISELLNEMKLVNVFLKLSS